MGSLASETFSCSIASYVLDAFKTSFLVDEQIKYLPSYLHSIPRVAVFSFANTCSQCVRSVDDSLVLALDTLLNAL
jgi:hypothetical protein